jgi:hypothetical protein
MKIIAVVLIFLSTAPQAFAQQTAQQTALMRKGTVKLWTGITLMCAGALVMPVTDTKASISSDGRYSTALATSSVGLFSVGGTLAWLGAQDRRKALSPQTTFRVSVGKRQGLEISRRW